MNGELEVWIKETRKLADKNKSRLDVMETVLTDYMKMSDERNDNYKWYMRAIFGTALATFLTVLARTIFKF